MCWQYWGLRPENHRRWQKYEQVLMTDTFRVYFTFTTPNINTIVPRKQHTGMVSTLEICAFGAIPLLYHVDSWANVEFFHGGNSCIWPHRAQDQQIILSGNSKQLKTIVSLPSSPKITRGTHRSTSKCIRCKRKCGVGSRWRQNLSVYLHLFTTFWSLSVGINNQLSARKNFHISEETPRGSKRSESPCRRWKFTRLKEHSLKLLICYLGATFLHLPPVPCTKFEP